jgi:hypothetical protein
VYSLLGAYGARPSDEQLRRFAVERAQAHGLGAELALRVAMGWEIVERREGEAAVALLSRVMRCFKS